MGKDVLFVCGSDAHGTPIVVNAEGLGMTPKALWPDITSILTMSSKGWASTSTSSATPTIRPVTIARMRWSVPLWTPGHVYSKEIELAYCPKCERFLPDRYVEGECPYCGKPARGDECDMGCGRHLEPGEIKNAVCKVCGGKAEYRRQIHYFF